MKNIEEMIDNIAEGEEEDLAKVEQALPLDKEASMSMKPKKNFSVDASIYSACYFSLIKSNKKKYRLT